MTLDVKAAIKDFQKYDEDTQRKFQKLLSNTATSMAGSQRRRAHMKAKTWTGSLASMIHVVMKGRWTRWIGPMGGVPYDQYIEDGTKAPPTGGNFKGYGYVKYSVWEARRYFGKKIKNIVDKT